MSFPKVAVIGCGYWGKNLVRVMHELGALELVYDVDPAALARMHSDFGVATADTLDAVMNSDRIGAVVIAAPAVQHYELARSAMMAGNIASTA